MNGIVGEDEARDDAINTKAVGEKPDQGDGAARSFDQGGLWPFCVERPRRSCDVRAGLVHQPAEFPPAAIDANAKIQATLPSDASPIIAGAIKEGKLKVVAARYDIVSGGVSLLA